MTIPTKEELRAGDAGRTTDEATAAQLRAAVLQELRGERIRIEDFIEQEGKNKHAIAGAIINAIATGIEIGIHIGEARTWAWVNGKR